MTSIAAAMLLLITQAADPNDPWPDDPAPLALAPSTEPERPWRPDPSVIAAGAVISATAIGLGTCAWLARDSETGAICTIAAGSLGLGMLLYKLVFSAIMPTELFDPDTPKEGDYFPLRALFRTVRKVILAPLLGGLAGLAGLFLGGVIAGAAGSPPGVQRGVAGVSASGVLFTVGVTLPFFW